MLAAMRAMFSARGRRCWAGERSSDSVERSSPARAAKRAPDSPDRSTSSARRRRNTDTVSLRGSKSVDICQQ